MQRLAGCLLVSGILIIGFSSILSDYLKPLWSLIAFGGIGVEGLRFIGLFAIGASFFSILYNRQVVAKKQTEEAIRRNTIACVKSPVESSIIDHPVEVAQVAKQEQPVQRPKIHLEIIMHLQLEYGTKLFRTRDAVKVVEDRLKADAASTRFALHWGRTQGRVVKVRHEIYQFVETAPVMNSSATDMVKDKGLQNKESVVEGQ